jgi:hypothetical protein
MKLEYSSPGTQTQQFSSLQQSAEILTSDYLSGDLFDNNVFQISALQSPIHYTYTAKK